MFVISSACHEGSVLPLPTTLYCVCLKLPYLITIQITDLNTRFDQYAKIIRLGSV